MSGRVFCSLAQTYVILLLMMNPLFFSFFSVFTEKTQLSHVSEVKYFLINLLLMMFCDCKFSVKFHFVWFVVTYVVFPLCLGNHVNHRAHGPVLAYLLFVFINNYCAISISFNFYCYRKNIMRPFEDHTSLVSAMQKEFLF